MAIKIPEKFTKNIRKDINYQIKVSPAVIKVPFDSEVTIKADAVGNEIRYVQHQGKEFEVVGEVHRDFQGKKEDYFLIRVEKKDFPKAYPYNSFGYFVLPPELEAVYGKRCTTLTDVCFMSNQVEEIFVKDNHVKFESGGMSCIGDGERANRFNPITQSWDKNIPCVCAYSKYYSDYNEGEQIATEVDISVGFTKDDQRVITKGNQQVTQVLVQGAWRDQESRSDNIIKLKPYADNKPPCDFNFEMVFMVPKVPGLHLNKIHSTGIDNYLRIKESVIGIQDILSKFGIRLIAQPMNLVLRIAEKNSKTHGKRLYPQISIEFAQSIIELINRSSKETYLGQGTPVPALTEKVEYVDENTGEYTEDPEGEEEFTEYETAEPIPEQDKPESSLKKEYEDLAAEVCKLADNPLAVTDYFKDKEITITDTEDFYETAIKQLTNLKTKLF